MNWDWTWTGWAAVEAIGTCVGAILVLASLGFLIRQLFLLRRSSYAECYDIVIRRLQDENVRKARAELFKLNEARKAASEWTDNEKEAAEIVCHTYATVGMMARDGTIPMRIVRNWDYSLVKSWVAAEPLVLKYRQERKAPDLWNDFEWLAKQLRKSGRTY